MRPLTDVVPLDSLRENKLSLVERLADDLAHEIKNPLHAMVINLEVLRRRIARLEDIDNEDLLRYTGVLGTELDRVNRRVDLLLRIARPDSSVHDIGSLAEIIEELRELLELECERGDLNLVIDLPVTALRARTSRAPARQIILTLALKAIDGLPRKGTLTISSEAGPEFMRVHVHGADAGGALQTSWSTGDLESLSLVRSLAEQLGGRVDAIAAPGGTPNGGAQGGRGFVVSLPRE